MSEKYKSREERRQASSKTKKGAKKKSKNLFKRIMIITLLIGIIGMVSGLTTFFVLASGAPPLEESLLKDPLSSKVYDMNGEQIYEFGGEKRTYVSLDEIPNVVKDAVIAVEDARFREHHGLDIIRLGGAVVANFTDGFGSEGASTISQQVIKNSILTDEKTIKRKAQELWLAFQLESKFSKDEILEMYLNKIYYGVGNTYGVARASELYFGKPLADLELHEAALLAGLGQNPGIYNPFVYPEAAEKRRNIVLNLMEHHGFISNAEAKQAKDIPVESYIVDSKPESQPIDAFLDQVKKEIKEKLDVDVYTAGLKIYTTFDPSAQAHVDMLLNTNEVIAYPNAELQAGVALLDTQTGEIRALGGGRNQTATNRINFAIDASNQPGSTIKPILDYGPAIEHLSWSTYQQIKDEPYTYSDGKPINNFDRKHMGQISLRTALAKSRNIPALKAFQEVGRAKAQEFAVNLGMPFNEVINEAYSIGGIKGGISPLQMAGAYSAFGNKGVFNSPHAVKKIIFPDDSEVELAPKPKTVMKDSTAFMITDVLKSVLEPGGTAAGYDVPGLHIAGKTGTTNYDSKAREQFNIDSGDVPDSWFAGYTPAYTAAIWTGYKDNSTPLKKGAEQQIAKQLFKSIITHVSQGKESSDFPVPKSVVEVAVEKGTDPAKLASEFTPKEDTVYEYFVKGTEPTEVSDKYKKLSPPGDLKLNFDKTLNELNITFAYPEEESEGISFEISVSIDEGAPQIIPTKDMALKIRDPIPGAKYTVQVVAVSDSNKENRSEPVVNSFEVPEQQEDDEDTNNPGNGNGNGNNGGGGDGGNGDDNGGDGEGEDDQTGLPDIIPPIGGNNT